jgi:transcriptional regulator with XRE-family HTH domain
MIDPKLVLRRIRNARKKQNYTIAQFAEKLNISCSAYAKLENGETALTIDRLNEIATILVIDTKDLLDMEKEEKELITKEEFKQEIDKLGSMLYVIVKEVNILKKKD